MDLDLAHIEKVEAELDAFVERRAAQRKEADEEAEQETAATRRRQEETRERNRAAWIDHYKAMYLAHSRLASSYAAKAVALEGTG